MQYFHHPLQPTSGGVDKEKVKGLTLWSKIEQALRKQSGNDQILFHAELKRLCLVVEAALELWDPQVNKDQDPQALFLRQFSIQLRVLAHMRKLTPNQVETAALQGNQRAGVDKSKSGAEHYLEALQKQIQLSEEQLLEGIGVQPLAAVLVEEQSLFRDLGAVFYRIHDHVTKRRGDVEHTLQQLLTLHSRKKPQT
ncbi:MAG: hypothetical protein WC314_06670 [Vulcanimicrobiota bacterium]